MEYQVALAGGVLVQPPPIGESVLAMSGRQNASRAVSDESTFAKIQQARQAFIEGRIEEAIQTLEEAERMDGNSIAVHAALGQLYMQQHTDEATTKALRHLRIARGSAPKDVGIAMSLAFALVEVGNWTEAVGVLRNALHFARNEEEQSEIHFLLGYVRMNTGAPDEAIREYREAIVLDRSNPFPALYLGKYLVVLSRSEGENTERRLEEALGVYEDLLEIDPQNIFALLNAAYVLHGLARFEEAAEMSRRALVISPDDGAALVNLASSTLNLARNSGNSNRFAEARELYERAAEVLERDGAPPAVRAEVQNGLGITLLLIHMSREPSERSGELLEAAKTAFRKALEVNPERHDLYASLGLVATLQGSALEAISYYKESLRLKPDDPVAFHNLKGLYTAMQKSTRSSRRALIPPSGQGRPRFGSAGGEVTVHESFDEPLDEFREFY